MPMTDEDIQNEGAAARASGKSQFDNPYFASDKVPKNTGETLREWNHKCRMWEFGWWMEDAIRKP